MLTPIRVDLARPFIRHGDDRLGRGRNRRADHIASTLIALSIHAVMVGGQEWLDRHDWCRAAVERRFYGGNAVSLDA